MLKIRKEQMAVLAKAYTSSNLAAELAAQGNEVARDDAQGELFVKDVRGHTTRLALDERGRLKKHTTPLGREYLFDYDSQHRLTDLTFPNGLHTRRDYNAQGTLASLLKGTNQRWSFEWDEWSNLSKITYPDGPSAEITYTGRDNPVSYTDRAGTQTRFEQDASGKLIAIVDPRGNRTAFEYHKWDRPERITRADGSLEEMARNTPGRISEAKLNGKPLAKIDYDGSGRLAEIQYADGHFVAFVYNESGEVIEARNPAIVVKRSFDDKNRLIEEEQGEHKVKYAYDAAGLLTSLTTPDGDVLKFTYDGDARLIEVQDWQQGIHRFKYDESVRSVQQRLPNGLVTETLLSHGGLPNEINTSNSSGTIKQLFALHYKYDLNDRVAQLTDSETGRRQFFYDAEGRVLRVKASSADANESFAYDANGNRTVVNSEEAGFDVLNQLKHQGQKKLVYDERGNVIEESGAAGVTRYSYNGQNLLVGVTLPDGRRVAYAYDAFARRISKSIGETKTHYIWAGEQLLCEWTEGAKPERRDYLFVPYSYVPLSVRVDKAVYHYHTDHKGCPRWITDGAGETVWSAEYRAFGESLCRTEVLTNALRFAGHYYDAETGLHYNRARYYSPAFGRYLSRDPLEFIAGVNFYIYAGNDPVNETDPLGLISWKSVLAATAVVAGVALVIVAAPVVVAGAVAIATGAAVAAGTAAAVGMAVGGAALVGAGIGLGMSPDGCLKCQIIGTLKGAAIGAGAMISVIGALFTAAGLAAAAGGGMGGGALLAGAGGGGGQIILTGAATKTVVLSGTSVVAGVMMMQGGQGGGGHEDFEEEPEPQPEKPKKMKAKDRRRMQQEKAAQEKGRPTEGTPRNNQAQNEQFRDAARGLNKEQQRQLHDAITKQNYTRDEIIKLRNEMFPNNPY
jgi:RHS repeat-associated protein